MMRPCKDGVTDIKANDGSAKTRDQQQTHHSKRFLIPHIGIYVDTPFSLPISGKLTAKLTHNGSQSPCMQRYLALEQEQMYNTQKNADDVEDRSPKPDTSMSQNRIARCEQN